MARAYPMPVLEAEGMGVRLPFGFDSLFGDVQNVGLLGAGIILGTAGIYLIPRSRVLGTSMAGAGAGSLIWAVVRSIRKEREKEKEEEKKRQVVLKPPILVVDSDTPAILVPPVVRDPRLVVVSDTSTILGPPVVRDPILVVVSG